MSLKYAFVLALALLFCSSHANAQPRMVSDEIDIAPPGRLIDVGGYQLHINCVGHGGPVVMLESGVGGFSLEWMHIQEALAEDAIVCAYDRAGYGWSDMGPLPRTAMRISDELHALMQNSGLPGPYILAGHSFGGLVAQYYARQYSDEVAALVLIDASHPEQFQRLSRNENNEYIGEMHIPERRHYMLLQPAMHHGYPERYRAMAMDMLSSWKSALTQREELVNMGFSGQQVLNAGSLPEMPLMVLTRGVRVWPETEYGDAMELGWMTLQYELSRLSPRGQHMIAEQAGHLIHLEEPALVIDVLRDVINQVGDDQATMPGRVLAEVPAGQH